MLIPKGPWRRRGIGIVAGIKGATFSLLTIPGRNNRRILWEKERKNREKILMFKSTSLG